MFEARPNRKPGRVPAREGRFVVATVLMSVLLSACGGGGGGGDGGSPAAQTSSGGLTGASSRDTRVHDFELDASNECTTMARR